VTVNKKKIKTLICILGQTRAQDITWDSFNKYLLKSLDADLALCIAEKKNKNNHMYKNAKYNGNIKIQMITLNILKKHRIN
tara:strand:+ start:527 stop:769 length:243 start_codon:yes stop_codon:yes gene_type:complete